jgi:type III secretory pathway lipoprotein EscJ
LSLDKLSKPNLNKILDGIVDVVVNESYKMFVLSESSKEKIRESLYRLYKEDIENNISSVLNAIARFVVSSLEKDVGVVIDDGVIRDITAAAIDAVFAAVGVHNEVVFFIMLLDALADIIKPVSREMAIDINRNFEDVFRRALAENLSRSKKIVYDDANGRWVVLSEG